MAEASEVMKTLIPAEREVHNAKGEAYLMRLSPYRTEEDRISGVVVTFINVTRRLKAEEDLRRSELRFRTVTNAIPQLIWTNEPGGIANYFNERWFEYSGLTLEESYGPGWQAMVHPEDAALSIERWHHALQAGEIFEAEYRLRRNDGVYRWFIGRNVPLHDDNGRILGWFGSATDIEELKQAEAAIRKTEARLRLIMESVKDYAIFTTDRDRLIDSWNKGAEAIFGYTEEEMIGRSADIIFTPEDRAKREPDKEVETALREGSAADERWHMRKDGSRFYASGVMTLLHNGSVHGFVKIARDLTQKMLSEQRLRASEERYQDFIAQSREGIWRFEMEQSVDTSLPPDEQIALIYKYSYLAECNEAMARMQGYGSAAEMKGVRLPDLLPPGAESDAYVRQFIDSGYRINESELHISDDEGAQRYFISNLMGIVEDGRLKHAWGMQRDVTERKLLEKMKDDFIGIASHELRTPVSTIKTYVELLEDTAEEKGNTESLAMIRKLDNQVDRLTALIRDLLDATRINEGRLPFNKEQLNLADLIREVVDELQLTVKHRLETDLKPIPLILADRERLRQVMHNLLSNAIKYSPDADRVRISAAPEGTGIKLCIQDFGIGMSDEVRRRLFDRFYRGGQSEANNYPGLGLGLYIASEIVQRHNGRIWVEQEGPPGSTVCIFLPTE